MSATVYFSFRPVYTGILCSSLTLVDRISVLMKSSVSLLSQKKLTTLDIAANRIKKIENISHLTDLQEFWVRFTQKSPSQGTKFLKVMVSGLRFEIEFL